MKTALPLALLLTLLAWPLAAAEYQYDFASDKDSFSGTDGWFSHYCKDPWTTKGSSGVFPRTDDGCSACGSSSNCTFGYDKSGSTCYYSDAADNHLTFGPGTWKDFTFESSLLTHGDDALGFVFRYRSSREFYALLLVKDEIVRPDGVCTEKFSGARLMKVKGGTGSTLAQKAGATFTAGKVHGVRITASGDSLRCEFDLNSDGSFSADEKLFDLSDSDPILAGQVGFYAYNAGLADECGSKDCRFGPVKVQVSTYASDPCGGLDAQGKCVGSTLRYCYEGQLKETWCSTCCLWSPELQAHSCAANASQCAVCSDECNQGSKGCNSELKAAWACGQADADPCLERIYEVCTGLGVCDPIQGKCPAGCTPNCSGKVCGDDGCAGTCGSCAQGYSCAAGQCQKDCVPSCTGRECGSDGCGGSCGSCGAPATCTEATGRCSTKGSCVGVCDHSFPDWGCFCDEQCINWGDCCPDICQACPALSHCGPCTPDCGNRQCGLDGCGGLCGTCPEGSTCGADGQCQGPPPLTTCNSLLLCLAACPASDQPCLDACAARATEGATEAFTQFQGCTSSNCPSCGYSLSCLDNCGANACSDSVGPCFPKPSMSCLQLWFCAQDCMMNQDCLDGCAEKGLPNALGKFNAVRACLLEACPDWNLECLTIAAGQHCQEELTACTGQCLPFCYEKECGSDGCGGSCGACFEGLFCVNGKCRSDEECLPHDHLACYAGKVYWFDSCEVREDLVEACPDGCLEGACLPGDVSQTKDSEADLEPGPDSQPQDLGGPADDAKADTTFSAGGKGGGGGCQTSAGASGLLPLLLGLLALALRRKGLRPDRAPN